MRFGTASVSAGATSHAVARLVVGLRSEFSELRGGAWSIGCPSTESHSETAAEVSTAARVNLIAYATCRVAGIHLVEGWELSPTEAFTKRQ